MNDEPRVISGAWEQSWEPVNFGWEGLLNRVRHWLGIKQSMMLVAQFKTDEEITIAPGETVRITLPNPEKPHE